VPLAPTFSALPLPGQRFANARLKNAEFIITALFFQTPLSLLFRWQKA